MGHYVIQNAGLDFILLDVVYVRRIVIPNQAVILAYRVPKKAMAGVREWYFYALRVQCPMKPGGLLAFVILNAKTAFMVLALFAGRIALTAWQGAPQVVQKMQWNVQPQLSTRYFL
jgi:hypothetical protein